MSNLTNCCLPQTASKDRPAIMEGITGNLVLLSNICIVFSRYGYDPYHCLSVLTVTKIDN